MQHRNSNDLSMPPVPDAVQAMFQPNPELAGAFLNQIASGNATMLDFSARGCRHMATAYQEWFNFMGRRLEQDAKFAAKISTLHEPHAFAGACSEFLAKATKDYQEEFARMAKLSNGISNDMSDAMQDMSGSNSAVLAD